MFFFFFFSRNCTVGSTSHEFVLLKKMKQGIVVNQKLSNFSDEKGFQLTICQIMEVVPLLACDRIVH